MEITTTKCTYTFIGLLRYLVLNMSYIIYQVSVTFDPMCYLSLPLPVKKERQLEVGAQYKYVTVPNLLK